MNRATSLCPRGDFVHVARLGGYYDLKHYRRCDHLVANTRGIVAYILAQGWPENRVHYLPNFPATRRGAAVSRASLDTPAEAILVLALGRLHPSKGFEILLEAVARVPHIYLWLAGEGPERGNLQELARGLELTNVNFAGQVTGRALNSLITQSRFTVLPSHAYETLGKTILESYAEGRAVVASDAGSRRELVREGETGLLYPMGDVGKLAETIEWLGSRPDVADRIMETLRNRGDIDDDRLVGKAHGEHGAPLDAGGAVAQHPVKALAKLGDDAPDTFFRQCVLVLGLRGRQQRQVFQPLVADQRLRQLGVALDHVDEVEDDAPLAPTQSRPLDEPAATPEPEPEPQAA